MAGSRAGFIDTNGFTVVLQGGISELSAGLGLVKTGAGTLVMNGVSGYTGSTVVEEGTLGGHGELQSLQMGAAVPAPGESAGLLTLRGDLLFSGSASCGWSCAAWRAAASTTRWTWAASSTWAATPC